MHVELLVAAALWFSAQAADPSGQPADNPKPPGELSVQYAEAKLRLAEANLKRVEQMNRRVARTVSPSVVSDYEQQVETARIQVEQAALGVKGEFAVWLRRAQSQAKAASRLWQSAVAGNRRKAGTFQQLDVERFRLRAEVARLQLDRGQALVGASRGLQLEWQVELLNNEIELLKEEAARQSPFVRYYPIFWY